MRTNRRLEPKSGKPGTQGLVALDIFSDRRNGIDRRQQTLSSPVGQCRREGPRAHRHGHGISECWWLRAEYVETDVLVQNNDVRRRGSESSVSGGN